MFPKKNRISKTEFDELLKKSAVFHNTLFSSRYVQTEIKKFPKVAFVVSKKVSKEAVGRNLLRRQCFHILRSIFLKKNTLISKNGYDIAFFLKKEIKSVSQLEIKKSLEEIMKKIGV